MFSGVPTAPFTLKFLDDPNSKIRVLIGVTMYQEPCSGLNDIRKIIRTSTQDKPENFAEQASRSGGIPGTMVGILENIAHWVKTKEYKWEEVCVCLLADGRTRIDGQFNNLQAMARMGMYVDISELYKPGGLMDIHARITESDRQRIDTVTDKLATRQNPRFTVDNSQTVYLHLFENVIYYKDYPPMQFMFALKEFNAGKLDTHLWFFEGFAHHIDRMQGGTSSELYCVCIDAGTRPGPQSIVKMIRALDGDENVAGVCGEIQVDKNLHPRNILYNWVVAAQNFEYKIGNLLDKCCESCLGFITVLPGAFSAYRWSALSPRELSASSADRPIVAYFKSVTHGGEMNPFFGNMFLAEDRVLCLELVCSKYGKNILRYVEGATAVTDVPDNCAALTKQRRRWLNGSFFAQVFAIWQGVFMFRIWRTNHNFFRKIFLLFEFLFLIANTALVWFLPGLYYLSFIILWRGFLADVMEVNGRISALGYSVFVGLQSVYLFLIFTTLILAMGTQPDSPLRSIRFLYNMVQFVFGILMLGTLGIAIRNIVIAHDWVLAGLGIINTGIYFLSALLHGELIPVSLTFIQYTFLQPTYINMVQIFAFCNTHDLSWGTKGLDVDNVGQKEVLAKRIEFRTFLVIGWSISNMLLAFVVNGSTGSSVDANVQFMKIMLFITLGFNAVRFIGSCMYLVGRVTRWICGWGSRRKGISDLDRQKEMWENHRNAQSQNTDWRKGTPHDPARWQPRTAPTTPC